MDSILGMREKGAITKSLILLELLDNKKKLREISSDLKITPQGASNYLKMLADDQMIDNEMGVTPKGIAFLQKFLANMTNFVERAYDEMGFISSCEAIAEEKINKNEKIFLSMNNGILVASKTKVSGSSGIAEIDADAGEPLIIRNMEGILSYKLGEFYIMFIDYSKYSSKENYKKIRKFINENKISVIGAYGVIAKSFLDKAKEEAIIYAPVEACIEATVKGLNTLLIYSPEMARYLFQKLAANVNKYKINPKFAEL